MILSLSVISKALYGGSRISWLALNRLGFLVWAQLIGGIIGIILTALLTPVLGLFGSALAFVLSDIFFFTIPSLVCSAQISGLSLKRVGTGNISLQFGYLHVIISIFMADVYAFCQWKMVQSCYSCDFIFSICYIGTLLDSFRQA